MTTIIRATDRHRGTPGVAFHLDDMAVRANGYIDKVRTEAKSIVAAAQREADAIRQKAEQEGRAAGQQAIAKMVQQQLAGVLSALAKVVQEMQLAKQAWLAQWEASGIHVAAAIAERLIRRELSGRPEIPLALVREALELAAGSSQVRIHLNVEDHKTIAGHVELLVKELSSLTAAEIIADKKVSAGGCRIETNFGVIDQQFEAQIARIEEELTATE